VGVYFAVYPFEICLVALKKLVLFAVVDLSSCFCFVDLCEGVSDDVSF